MLVVGLLAASVGLVLGLRFSVITFIVLTVAILVMFAMSVLGGRSSARSCLSYIGHACFRPNQLSLWLSACCTFSGTPNQRLPTARKRDTCAVYQRVQLRADASIPFAEMT